MAAKPIIVWFRQDLRLTDNPALAAAAKQGAPVLPVYILDDENSGEWRMGGASRWWLHESLSSLNASLKRSLYVARGDAASVLDDLIENTGAQAVYWNRCYEPWRIKRDARIKSAITERDIEAKSFNGSLLFEPHTVAKADGTPYKVFTPFYRKGCLGEGRQPREAALDDIKFKVFGGGPPSAIDDLGLMPDIEWYAQMAEEWEPGESGAEARLQQFLDSGLQGYKVGRNRPDQTHVSRLSPHLHFGEISPHRVWWAARALEPDPEFADDVDCLCSELGWREFAHYLLYHEPQMPQENLQTKFERFPWRESEADLKRWQRGDTGIPIVDAGMRELWQTGYMHNRVRMIVASFLTKNLLIHWRDGEAWFWDTLLDADLANNSASWQWVAGCGTDAAPYFRIFNPVTQGKKFDPNGNYVRQYVPEVAGLSDKFLHEPWAAPEAEQEAAGLDADCVYRKPMADLKASRERALEAFKSL